MPQTAKHAKMRGKEKRKKGESARESASELPKIEPSFGQRASPGLSYANCCVSYRKREEKIDLAR